MFGNSLLAKLFRCGVAPAFEGGSENARQNDGLNFAKPLHYPLGMMISPPGIHTPYTSSQRQNSQRVSHAQSFTFSYGKSPVHHAAAPRLPPQTHRPRTAGRRSAAATGGPYGWRLGPRPPSGVKTACRLGFACAVCKTRRCAGAA